MVRQSIGRSAQAYFVAEFSIVCEKNNNVADKRRAGVTIFRVVCLTADQAL